MPTCAQSVSGNTQGFHMFEQKQDAPFEDRMSQRKHVALVPPEAQHKAQGIHIRGNLACSLWRPYGAYYKEAQAQAKSHCGNSPCPVHMRGPFAGQHTSFLFLSSCSFLDASSLARCSSCFSLWASLAAASCSSLSRFSSRNFLSRSLSCSLSCFSCTFNSQIHRPKMQAKHLPAFNNQYARA